LETITKADMEQQSHTHLMVNPVNVTLTSIYTIWLWCNLQT